MNEMFIYHGLSKPKIIKASVDVNTHSFFFKGDGD